MPTGNSFYQRQPKRFKKQRMEFRRLIEELKRLAKKRGYSRKRIASDLGVTTVCVHQWLERVFSNGQERHYRAFEEFPERLLTPFQASYPTLGQTVLRRSTAKI